MKQIFQLFICIISQLGHCPSGLGWVPPMQFHHWYDWYTLVFDTIDYINFCLTFNRV